MKRQPDQINTSLTQAALATRLDNATPITALQYEVPVGAAVNQTPLPFVNCAKSTSRDGNANPSVLPELSFGAPQIDLALPSGSLISAGLHQFNPRHYRDQTLTFKCALALATRCLSNASINPIYCFVPQDQGELISWLSKEAATTLGIDENQLIVVTARHSDDLLWAIEETMHGAAPTAIVAHVHLLDNLCAQRIAFTARTKGVPALITTNHHISGPDHATSAWSIEQVADVPAEQNTCQITACLTLTAGNVATAGEQNHTNSRWVMKWRSDRMRFAARPCIADTPRPTVH